MYSKTLAEAASLALAQRSLPQLHNSSEPSLLHVNKEIPKVPRRDCPIYCRAPATTDKTREKGALNMETIDPDKLDRTCLEVVKMAEIQQVIQQPVRRRRQPPDSIDPSMPDAFRSMCICVGTTLGLAVQTRTRHYSLGPRALKFRARSFLDNSSNPERQTNLCTLAPRPGPDRRPIFVLEYASPLVDEATNLPTCVFAAQIDVTQALQDFVTAVALEKRRAKLEPPSPRIVKPLYLHPNVNLGDSAICLVEDVDGNEEEAQEVDWLNVDSATPALPISETQPTIECFPSHLKEHLASLIHHVKSQYERIFVLSPASEFDEDPEWQISFTSPSIHCKPADVQIALSKTDADVLVKLGKALTGKEPVKLRVRWGERGQGTWLVAHPMFNGVTLSCWMCFLVDY